MSEATDFNWLTPAQLDVLCNVAFGGQGRGCHPRTLTSLERRGLIGRVTHVAQVALGSFTWSDWEMPLAVHIEFCQWCDEVGALDYGACGL